MISVTRVEVQGRLYVPEPDEPTREFFAHLVQLGDSCSDELRWQDAFHWYDIACMRAPRGLMSRQERDTFDQFVRRACTSTEDPRTRAARARAACAVVLQAGVLSP